ncbi:MAG: TerB family tellurite resistance protein [Bacteroidota bacterium]
MALSDLYLRGGQKRDISHFANIVKIAQADGTVTDEERELLKFIALKYEIEEEKFNEIFKDPNYYPIRAQLSCEERIERLYDLLKMVFADHKKRSAEVSMLRKIVVGLAFPLQLVDDVVIQAVNLDIENISIGEFREEMMKIVEIKH